MRQRNTEGYIGPADSVTVKIRKVVRGRGLDPSIEQVPTRRHRRHYKDGKDQVTVRLSGRSDEAGALALRYRLEQEGISLAREITDTVGIEWRGIKVGTFFANDGPTYVEVVFKDTVS